MSARRELTPQEQLTWLLRESVDDPAFFVEYILRPDLGPRWKWQQRVCRAIRSQLARGDRSLVRVLIRSCHGAGKTWLAAALVLWWTSTRPRSRTLTLAQSWAGVEGLIWPNIAALFAGSILRGSSKIEMHHTSLTFDRPESGGESEWYAIGASSDVPARLEGHHSKVAAMRVVDEAKEVDEAIFESTEGMLDAPENFDLWISTPSIGSGAFYRRDTGLEKGSEKTIRTVIDVDQLIEDGVEEKRAWRDHLREKWGVDSAEYQSRVMARYIDNADGALFPSSWVERAMSQHWRVEKPVLAALDVAGSIDGDQNALAIVAGPDSYDHVEVRSIAGWHERDTMVTKGRALKAVRESGARALRVDVIGLGQGVADAARQDGASVAAYRASEKPRDTERFLNRKAEDAWTLRTRLEQGTVRLPADQELKSQLIAMRYEILASGKTRVVDPSDSPDKADAVIIACAGVVKDGPGLVQVKNDRREFDDERVTVESLSAY